MQSFQDWLTELGRSAATIRAYLIDLGLFAAWFHQTNGERFDRLFTPTDVREYKAHLIRGQAAITTINRKLTALRVWGNWLVATGQAEANPAKGARNVKEQKAAPQWLDRQQQARLTRAIEKDLLAAREPAAVWAALRNQAAVILMLNSGLRVAELCALDVADITLGDRSGSVRVRAGKGEKARTVALNLTARRALAAWLVGPLAPTSGPLFAGRAGGRLTTSGAYKLVAGFRRKAAIPDLRPHQLRHTFAKNLRNANVDIEQVAALMGHSSIETTSRYTVPDARDLERAVSVLDG